MEVVLIVRFPLKIPFDMGTFVHCCLTLEKLELNPTESNLFPSLISLCLPELGDGGHIPVSVNTPHHME